MERQTTYRVETDYPPLSPEYSAVVIKNRMFRYLNYLAPARRLTAEGAHIIAPAMAALVARPEHRAWLHWHSADPDYCESHIAVTLMERARVDDTTMPWEVAHIIGGAIADVVKQNARLQ